MGSRFPLICQNNSSNMVVSEKAIAAAGVDPASQEAQELRQTGMRPLPKPQSPTTGSRQEGQQAAESTSPVDMRPRREGGSEAAEAAAQAEAAEEAAQTKLRIRGGGGSGGGWEGRPAAGW